MVEVETHIVDSAPLVICGLGGSGTRSLARVLEAAGVYMGNDLNPAHDSLTFTFLLKRPAWFDLPDDQLSADARRHLRLLGEVLTGRRLAPESKRLVRAAADEFRRLGYNRDGSRDKKTAFMRVGRIKSASRAIPPDAAGWGWKEPNSHIYLREIAEVFPEGRVIFLSRHGLDMAFSSNVQQYENWGPRFGFDAPPTPRRLFEFWHAMTERAEELGRACFGDRFCVVSFEELCGAPGEVIGGVLAWLGLSTQPGRVAEYARIVEPPRSIGRYRVHDLSWFTDRHRAMLAACGYAA